MTSVPSTQTRLRLDQCLDRIVDNRGRTPPLTDDGVEMIEINALVENRKSPAYEYVKKFVSQETYASWFRAGHPKCGDTLISTVGAIGRVAYFQDERGCIAQNIISLRPRRDLLDPEFLYYYLSSKDTQARLANLNIGVAQPSLKVPHLMAIEISFFPLPIQRRIASILSAYDDLIENHRKRIAILEDMARRLYREWFVHFRYPGHEAVPLVDSPLGRIPQGWIARRFGEVIVLNYGKALKAEERKPGSVPVYGSSGVVGYHTESMESGPGLIVGRKGNVGSLHWSDGPFYPIDTVYFASSSVFPLRYLLHSMAFMNFLNNDAAVPGLSRQQAYGLDVVVPTEDLLRQFCGFSESWGQLASNLIGQNDNLRRTRDLLLPRLMSGTLSVDALATAEASVP